LYHLRQGGITQTFHDEIATELEKKQQKLIKRPISGSNCYRMLIQDFHSEITINT
jgi:hypothetical protein